MSNYNNKNYWKNKTTNNRENAHNLQKSQLKFKEAQIKLQAAVQKHAKEFESSSEEEDVESDNIIGILKFNKQ